MRKGGRFWGQTRKRNETEVNKLHLDGTSHKTRQSERTIIYEKLNTREFLQKFQ